MTNTHLPLDARCTRATFRAAVGMPMPCAPRDARIQTDALRTGAEPGGSPGR